MSEHTQGKWEVKPKLANGTRHFNIVVNMPEKVICQTNVPGFGGLEPSPVEIKANAEHICRCVNSHDELVATVGSLLISSMVMLDDLGEAVPSRIRFERTNKHKEALALLETIKATN